MTPSPISAPLSKLCATATALLVLSLAGAAEAQGAGGQLSVGPSTATGGAEATTPAPAAPQDPKPEGPTAAQKKARYSLPWLMRPAVAPNLIRLDGALAFWEGPNGNKTTTIAPILTAGLKPFDGAKDLGLYMRIPMVKNSPDKGEGATVFANPLLMALWTPEVATGVRVAPFLAMTLPIGAGLGDTPNATSRSTVATGISARQAMDNALFATNYFTVIGGLGGAYIAKGFTAQLDLTVLQLTRVQGAAKDTDSGRTNFTAGLHLGYQVIPLLTVSAELHHQQWLSTPAAVEADNTKRQQLTAGGGLRFNIPLNDSIIMRPGAGFFVGLDDPMAAQKYKIVQLDLPIAF